MRRTFKPYKELNNFMIKDVINLWVEKKCDSCEKYHNWDDIQKCEVDNIYSVICLKCKEPMIASLNVIIGMKQNLPFQTYVSENQIFLPPEGVRENANNLYETRLEQSNGETFDLMILREINKQIFWNCIYYMIEYGLPYDFLLPYEDTDDILRYKYEAVTPWNPVEIADPNDKSQFAIFRSRRNKSEIPHF